MSHDGKRPVTLEDLLRLKRAERPAPEFWEQFDRELRAKQLAALVRKRPWWRELPRAFVGLTRYRLPVGAAAVLAVTFVTVRDFSTTPDDLDEVERVSPTATAVRVAAPEVTPRVELQVPAETYLAGTDTHSAIEAVNVADAVAIESNATAVSVPVIPLLVGAVESTAADDRDSPSARSIAANLAVVRAAEMGGRSLLGGARTFDSHAVATRTLAVEPLQQMTTPSEVRLARYRSPLVATVTDDSADRTGERIARRISGDRLYDHIGRIGARGDSVSWKF